MVKQQASEAPPAEVAKTIDVSVRRKFDRFSLDISFSTEANRVVLFGPSGSGKSLTLRAIAGILRAESAHIVVGGRVLDDDATGVHLRPNDRRVGYVPQGYALFPHMSVRQNVLYGLAGVPEKERARRFAEVIRLVGLAGLESRNPQELSGGQQQRVALARALAVEPVILLLDEPFASIDAPFRSGLRSELAGLQSITGTSMLTVTHDLSDAFALGDWIVVVDEGRVLQQGGKDEVYLRPATKTVAEMVGIRNILRGVVGDISGDWLSVNWNGQTLMTTVPASRFHSGDPVDVCIRSTHLMIRRQEDVTFGERLNVMAGLIVDEVIVAETRRLFIRLHNSPSRFDLEIDLPEYTYFRLGLDLNKEIDMQVRPERIHLLGVDLSSRVCLAKVD